MSERDFQKTRPFLTWVRFKVGEFFFPVLEPVFRMRENWDSEVKKHFHQAIQNLEENRTTVALLNLNMVLSMQPRHFLARVYRGKIYLNEGRSRLATEDFLHSNKISPYRFLHYHLSAEYFASVKKEFGEMGVSITKNFDQIFEVLRQTQGNPKEMGEVDDGQDPSEQFPDYDNLEFDMDLADAGPLEESESQKFQEMGPITRKEISTTDWNKLIKELTS
jgi:tetratricopeptide (TPR) repeat protein